MRVESGIDLYADEALLDPYPYYAELRAQGSAVWLTKLGVYALPRFAGVRDALADWLSYTSAKGVGLNETINSVMAGSTLGSDPPEHDHMKNILMRPLGSGALQAIRAMIASEAEAVVARLVDKGRFDAATELAPHLPLTIVSQLVGLPEEGRQKMLAWATAGFDAAGPMNARAQAAFPLLMEMVAYQRQVFTRDRLMAGGWARLLFDAVEADELSPDAGMNMLLDYLGPSLDTTIAATANAIWLFAEHPEQWDAVRSNPGLLPNAINEIVRLESPLQGFTRVTTRDLAVEGYSVPKGSRVLLLYGSANRDERKWSTPARFDVRRADTHHLGFGHGVHGCAGANLARLEILSILEALIPRVTRFRVDAGERSLVNLVRGWKTLTVSIQ